MRPVMVGERIRTKPDGQIVQVLWVDPDCVYAQLKDRILKLTDWWYMGEKSEEGK